MNNETIDKHPTLTSTQQRDEQELLSFLKKLIINIENKEEKKKNHQNRQVRTNIKGTYIEDNSRRNNKSTHYDRSAEEDRQNKITATVGLRVGDTIEVLSKYKNRNGTFATIIKVVENKPQITVKEPKSNKIFRVYKQNVKRVSSNE